MTVRRQGKQSEYRICAKTVMDTSDPSIVFDEDGVSNHYWDFQNVVSKNWHVGPGGRAALERQVDAIKAAGKGRDFDCIIGLSGGADSSYMLHVMVREFGLRPLVFHVDAGWNSDVAVSNINVLVDKLGLDLFTEVINWEEMRNFQLAMFKSGVPHLDVPQDMAFIGVLYKFAEKHGIKYILNGGNISTECVGIPLQYLYWGSDMSQVRDILARYGSIPMLTYPFSSIWYHKFYLRLFKGVRVLKPLNFMPYVKKDAMAQLERTYGWRPYPQKHFESRFTRFFEGYWLPTRFAYDMRRREYSSLILTEQMSRDEAISLLESPSISNDIAMQEFSYIASKLGITDDELRVYLLMPKKFYWDYANQSRLFALGERALNVFTSAVRGGAY
jgi:N-acetyl sugar amidotransferase